MLQIKGTLEVPQKNKNKNKKKQPKLEPPYDQ